MIPFSLCLLGLILAAGEELHSSTNRVYQELLTKGVPVTPTAGIKLPPPTMPDGLGASGQRAVIEKIADRNRTADELLRKSPVSPFQYKISDLMPSDPDAPSKGVDVWFVVYGDLDAIVKKNLWRRFLHLGQKQATVQDLTAEDLARRGIKLDKGEGHQEVYTHRVFAIFEKVQVSDTCRLFMTSRPGSLVVASQLDPRFTDDPKFPNYWQSLRPEDGKTPFGPRHPASVSARYLKITQLIEPAGALFVEVHIVFSEPKRWFDGANLLRSKLPVVLTTEIRALRRDLGK
jgi:hypothetical protein